MNEGETSNQNFMVEKVPFAHKIWEETHKLNPEKILSCIDLEYAKLVYDIGKTRSLFKRLGLKSILESGKNKQIPELPIILISTISSARVREEQKRYLVQKSEIAGKLLLSQ
jgi:hypothetical protein